jgi:protein TonB
MTADHPLFSFMPYGAPEQLRDERRNLFRATLIASLACTLALALAAALPRSPDSAPEVMPGLMPTFSPERYEVQPEAERFRTRSSGPVTQDRAGEFKPVKDIDAPVDVQVAEPGTLVEDGDVGTGRTPEGPPSEGGRSDPVIPGDTTPPFGSIAFVDEYPVAITQPKPAYPSMAMDAGIEGTVLVHVLVDRNGRVAEVRANRDRTVPILEGAALEAARRWVFRPALSNGHAVAVWVTIPFEFRLH